MGETGRRQREGLMDGAEWGGGWEKETISQTDRHAGK